MGRPRTIKPHKQRSEVKKTSVRNVRSMITATRCSHALNIKKHFILHVSRNTFQVQVKIRDKDYSFAQLAHWKKFERLRIKIKHKKQWHSDSE